MANLAGRFDMMKEVLAAAPVPFGPSFVDRVVWKTNQEVPEESCEVSVKLLIHIQALMNNRAYPPAAKVCSEVYTRSGVTIREFSEAEGDDQKHYEALTRLLPQMVKLYDHIYAGLPEVDPAFPWADGKLDQGERKRKRAAAYTPFIARPCTSKVLTAFVWPIYSVFRTLLVDDAQGLRFKIDPIGLFDEMKTELASRLMAFHRNGAHGMASQIGKDKEIWLRLQDRVEHETELRARLAARA